MEQQDKTLWESYEVEDVELNSETEIGGTLCNYRVTVKALSFFFEKAKLSIYKDVNQKTLVYTPTTIDVWAMTAWNNAGIELFTRHFEGTLNDISRNKHIGLSSALNASKIVSRNGPRLIMEISAVMAEHLKEIEHKKYDPVPTVNWSDPDGKPHDANILD